MSSILQIFLLSVLAAVAVIAATEITAKSHLFKPVRDYFFRTSMLPLFSQRGGARLTRRQRINRLWRGFVSDLINCPFCSSCWHAFWILALLGQVIGGALGVMVAAYLPAIGLAKILHDAFRREKPPAPSFTMTVTGQSVRDLLPDDE